MQPQTKSIVIGIIVLLILVVALKTCQRMKQIEIKQKINDDKTALSVEIKKEKPAEIEKPK